MCTNYSLISHHRSCEVDFSWASRTLQDISASDAIQSLKWSKFKRGIFFPNIVSKIHDPKERDVIEAAFRDLGDSYRIRSFPDRTLLCHSAQRFVPCGKCSECLNKRSKLYALRCLMEAREHKEVCSLVLTYDREHLGNNVLKYGHVQAFFKRLREYVRCRYGKTGLKFFAVGEHGASATRRMHWHMMIFGWKPDKDREEFKVYPSGKTKEPRFKSLKLQELWEQGYVDVSEFDDTHAFYIARYCQKKFVQGSDLDSTIKQPMEEQKYCSPQLGNEYFFKHMKTFLREGKIEVSGYSYPIPRCFKDLMKKLVSEDPEFQTKYYADLRKRLDLSLISKFLKGLYDLARQRKVELKELFDCYNRAVANMANSPLKPHTSDHDGELEENFCVNTS